MPMMMRQKMNRPVMETETDCARRDWTSVVVMMMISSKPYWPDCQFGSPLTGAPVRSPTMR